MMDDENAVKKMVDGDWNKGSIFVTVGDQRPVVIVDAIKGSPSHQLEIKVNLLEILRMIKIIQEKLFVVHIFGIERQLY